MWVRLDAAAPLHPKLLEAGPEAAWLWVCGLAHCNRSTTDGRVKKTLLPSLFPSGDWSALKIKQLAKRLCEVRLWEDDGSEFYLVHDYHVQQDEALKANVEARREYERARKTAQRAAKRGPLSRGHRVPSVPDTVPDSPADEVPDVVPDFRNLSPPPTDPTDPTDPISSLRSETRARARARSLVESASEPEAPPPVRGALSVGYQRRYEAATSSPWMSAGKHTTDIDLVARWCAANPEPLQAVEDVLDGVFGDAWMAERRWPWGPIAKDPARFADAERRPRAPGGGRAEPLPNAAYVATSDAELEAMFGDVSPSDLARVERGRRSHG